MQDKYEKAIPMIEHEIGAELDKNINSGSFPPDSIYALTKAFKLKCYMEDELDGGQSEYSGRRGRSRVTGRYMSRDRGSYDDRSYENASRRNSFGSYDGNRGSYRGYSGHTMVEQLERMYDEAHDDKERQMIEEWIRKAEMAK